jgi:hypothetical protein
LRVGGVRPDLRLPSLRFIPERQIQPYQDFTAGDQAGVSRGPRVTIKRPLSTRVMHPIDPPPLGAPGALNRKPNQFSASA